MCSRECQVKKITYRVNKLACYLTQSFQMNVISILSDLNIYFDFPLFVGFFPPCYFLLWQYKGKKNPPLSDQKEQRECPEWTCHFDSLQCMCFYHLHQLFIVASIMMSPSDILQKGNGKIPGTMKCTSQCICLCVCRGWGLCVEVSWASQTGQNICI